MGCDVHAHFEIKVDGEWLHYSQPNIKRNYQLFEKMAGVRGDVKNAITPPKGLPEDSSKTTLLHSEDLGPDGHSHSWLSSNEFIKLYDFHKEIYRCNLWEINDKIYGYLFKGTFNGFLEYPGDYPKYLEDFRLVFWFDN